jgi:mono/diheme cytochrome c family protein
MSPCASSSTLNSAPGSRALSPEDHVAEVPPHLLDRAKARRAALSGEGVEAPSPTPSDSAVVATVVAASVDAGAAVAAADGSPKVSKAPGRSAPPKVEKVRGAAFAKISSVFLLAGLPIWAIFMFNTWSTPQARADTPQSIGQSLYNVNCASCHGGDGAGSDRGLVGRPLYNGEAEKTFPDPIDQAAFVKHGSCGAGQPYGDPKREGGQHAAKTGMPAFPTLSDAQLIYLVNYERNRLQSTPKDFPVNVLAKVGEDQTVVPEEPFDAAAFQIPETLQVCP